MGGGRPARAGFMFQDLVLAERVVTHVASKRLATVEGKPPPASPEFRVETGSGDSDSPDWDLVEQGNHRLVIEEVKSGALNAEDRRILWRRIRRTITNADVSSRRIEVRLTVNQAALPENPDRWRALANISQTAPAEWTIPQGEDRHPPVRSAQDLAREALHWLTEPSADASHPLTAANARLVLSNFSFNEAWHPPALEERIGAVLRELTGDLGVEELVDALHGAIARRAASEVASDHSFTAEDLERTITVIGKLASIDGATLTAWRHIREHGRDRPGIELAAGNGLPYRSWRDVQPTVARELDRVAGCLALLGRGGQGKTVLLGHWCAEQEAGGAAAVWITGHDLAAVRPELLASAIDIGAFAARQQKQRLIVIVDALENVGTTEVRKATVAALGAGAAAGAIIVASCRTVDWRSARGSHEVVPHWSTIDLDEWSEALVREHVRASQRSGITDDLVKLLRTPLLLDLFLRAFGVDTVVPPGLQSRHGLLRAYWDRRVLPAADERAAERRELLLRFAGDEASGRRGHTASGRPAEELTSEGLFVLERGQRVFRHVLLRDFTMMIWAFDGSTHAQPVIEKLASITTRLMQYGALRATLEAAGDPTVRMLGANAVVAALAPPLLFDAAIVLGELDDPRDIDVDALLKALPPERRQQFAGSLVASAKVAANIGWLHRFAELPITDSATAWMDAEILLAVAAMIESVLAKPDPRLRLGRRLERSLAQRIRFWTSAPKLMHVLRDNAGGSVIRVLTALDAGPETAEWLLEVARLGAGAKYWVLSELPAFARNANIQGHAVPDALLADVYVEASNLRWQGRRLRERPGSVRGSMSTFERIQHALTGEPGRSLKERPALLRTRPAAFVPIALALLAGNEADEDDARAKRREEWNDRVAEALQTLVTNASDEFDDLEAAARDIVDAPEYDVEPGELVLDDLTNPYWDILDSEYGHLLLALQAMTEASLGADARLFDEVIWPSVSRGSSVLARVCILDLLTRSRSATRLDALDSLLADARLYRVKCAQVYLRRGMELRWSHYDVDIRATTLRNIVGAGRSEVGSVYRPGPLLAAIPAAERPVGLNVFLELYKKRGWPLHLEEATAITAHVGPREWPEPAPAAISDATSCERRWGELAMTESAFREADEEGWARRLTVVEELATRCLHAPTELLGRANLVESLARFMMAHARRCLRLPAAPSLSESIVRAIAQWAIASAGELPPPRWIGTVEPLRDHLTGLPDEGALWAALVELADAALWDQGLKEDPALGKQLFAIIDAAGDRLPGRLAFRIFDGVTGWVRGVAAGRSVLKALLVERVRDGIALSRGLRFVEWLSVEEQKHLLRHWLTTALDPPMESAKAFARMVGHHVGWAALTRYEDGRKTGSAEIVGELIVEPSSSGLLSDTGNFVTFVGQLALGCKEALCNGAVPTERATEYTSLVSACWTALAPLLNEGTRSGDAPAFALWVFHPILDDSREGSKKWSDEELRDWWRLLEPLACSVVGKGPSREIWSLLRLLRESRLIDVVGASHVKSLIDMLDRRVAAISQQPVDFHWDDSIACASAVAERLAALPDGGPMRDALYNVVSRWAAPPLSVEAAAAAAKRLRDDAGT